MAPDKHQSNSLPEPQAVECPHCMAPNNILPVTVVTPDSPELAELMSGALNRIQCVECDSIFILDVPLLYRDNGNRFLVYLMPLDDKSKWPEAELQMERITQHVFGDDIETPNCRIVFNRGDLIEKIALAERGLDDRIVEYVKYQLYRNPYWGDSIDPVRHRLLFDFSAESQDDLSFLVFDRESGQAVAGTHLPLEDYREVEESFLSNLKLREEFEMTFPGAYVNVDRLLDGNTEL